LNGLYQKMKEVTFAVLPIMGIVVLLHLSVYQLETDYIFRFFIGAAFIILGLSVFLYGVDIGVSPIGSLVGKALAKSNKLMVVTAGALLLGFIISFAEPDLHILAGQIDTVTSGMISSLEILLIVSAGIAVMLAFGLIRIVYSIPLYLLLFLLYLIVFVLSLFTPPELLAISFDASGATTGALTVPFILALALGVSTLKKDSKGAEKDSFGLVAIASTGAIIAVLIMSVSTGTEKLSGTMQLDTAAYQTLMGPFFKKIPQVSLETAAALAPLAIIFFASRQWLVKQKDRIMRRIVFGLFYAFLGLVLFIVGVNAGFMDVGLIMGYQMASMDMSLLAVIMGFVLGAATILAEPAVHVLTRQIEEVTSGSVKRRLVLIALSVGVGAAVALSMLRIFIPAIQLWHYLLPGYIIALVLALLGPKLFVGIAFDSGGVASGPMTATFILAFAQGAASVGGADMLADGFGIIAMVALTPLITIQILGLIYNRKLKKGKKRNAS